MNVNVCILPFSLLTLLNISVFGQHKPIAYLFFNSKEDSKHVSMFASTTGNTVLYWFNILRAGAMRNASHLPDKFIIMREMIRDVRKRQFISLIFFFLLTFSSKAQQKIKIGENGTAKNTFLAKTIGYGQRLIVNSDDDIITAHENNPSSLQRPSGVHYSKQDLLYQTVKSELGINRIKELLPERYLVAIMYYNGKGKIIAVQFMLKANSRFTIEEIGRLMNAIRENVSFSISPEKGIDKSKRFVPLVHHVIFDKLLEL